MVSKHSAIVEWSNSGPDFAKGKYSREHTWRFDGGIVVPASPSPSVIPLPWSNPANVDPEEAFIAALASCHMLTFLWLAAKERRVLRSYFDKAQGVLTKNEKGVSWMSEVILAPKIEWDGDSPAANEIAELHELCHGQCFIAQSVRTKIIVRAEQTG